FIYRKAAILLSGRRVNHAGLLGIGADCRSCPRQRRFAECHAAIGAADESSPDPVKRCSAPSDPRRAASKQLGEVPSSTTFVRRPQIDKALAVVHPWAIPFLRQPGPASD